MKIKKLVALSLAGLMAVSALAGCSSSSSDSSSSSSSGGSTATVAEDGSAWSQGTNVYFNVPAKAGGGTDLYTRYMTQALSEVCDGVNFVVNNYDTEEVGMEATKNADPDGLTLGTGHGGAIIKYLSGSSEVSLKDDMKIVGLLNLGGPQAIITTPDAPYTNFQELADYIKANPGDVVIGCSLGGTTQVLFTALIEALVGDASLVNFVQCSSEADKLTNVAAGSIDIANCSIPNAQSYDADGKLTILGTLGPQVATLENMSELVGLELDEKYATTLEQGVDVTWDSNYYIYVPKDTPDEICQAINDAICEASQTESFLEGNNAMATYTDSVGLADAQAAFETEWETQDALLTSMGLKVR